MYGTGASKLINSKFFSVLLKMYPSKAALLVNAGVMLLPILRATAMMNHR